MYPDQLGKPQPLHPPSSAENDKHSEEHIYEQLDPTCTSLDSLPLVETDPEEIGQLWDEVQASQMVIPGKAIAPHVAMAPTTDDLYAHCLDSRGIRVDDDDKNVFVYKFFGTLRTTPPLLCQDCPWIAPACVLRFTRQLPYSYSRMSFVDLIHSTVLLRSPLGHSFSDGKGYKWHAERCLGDVDGGNFGSDWKTAPDLSKQGGLTAPPKRPGSLTSRSNVSHGRAAVPPVAGPGLALFCQSPHVSYWLRMPEGLSPGLLKPTFSIQNRLVLPYLSVFYSQPGDQHRDVSVGNLAAAASNALYNRFRVAVRTDPSELKHFGLTVTSANLDNFQLWLMAPVLRPGVGRTGERAAASKWNGAEMSMLLHGRWSDGADVLRLVDWLNEIHRYGTGAYANAVEEDLRSLATPDTAYHW